MGLYPIQWRTLIIAKNLAALALLFAVLIPVALVEIYFSPALPLSVDFIRMSEYLLTILFPLLIIGNTQSLIQRRRVTGWQYEDFMEIFWCAGELVLISIPYFVLRNISLNPVLYLAIFAATGLAWWTRSVPKTARTLEEKFTEFCEET